ncbi:hypothetical protein [Wolbachia endosymbiont of Pentidionis agamae]|uniref:hypothetical protein n=1 Tax=Wolbachia endosymbiont of Pentidionis agamae TaxID=3110435 RepID=UPI002FD42EA4
MHKSKFKKLNIPEKFTILDNLVRHRHKSDFCKLFSYLEDAEVQQYIKSTIESKNCRSMSYILHAMLAKNKSSEIHKEFKDLLSSDQNFAFDVLECSKKMYEKNYLIV